MRFTRPVVLEETKLTRRCFYGELASDSDGVWDLRGSIVHERRGSGGEWHPLDGEKLNKLKAGELSKLELRTEHLRKLLVGLHVLKAAAQEEGIDLSGADLVIGKRAEMLRVDEDMKPLLEQVIATNQVVEFWEMLSRSRPQLAAQLADAELLRQRRSAIITFETNLRDAQWSEAEWEAFFQSNQWIFGLGLRFQFLGVLQNQANYGGSDYTRKGEQKGEFLMNTEGDERFTVLVEIKKPNSGFFANRADAYRNGVPGFEPNFMNAISQVQVNTYTWEVEGSRRDRDRERLGNSRVRTISPRSILVYGHTQQLDTDEKRKAFELFRCRLVSPEIVTFDELLARARFITRDSSSPENKAPQPADII